jgi:multidrug efflux system membrane fusion protein
MMRQNTTVILAIAIALLGRPVLAAEAGPAQPMDVRVTPALRQDVPIATSAVGRVQALNTVLLKSRVDGPITKVLFTEGDHVRPGQALFEIDPRPYRAAVDQAEAQLARDRALVASARSDFDRTTRLLDSGFASRQAFDRQTATLSQAEATVRMDQAAVDSARLSLSFTRIVAPIDGRIGKRLVDAGNLIHASDGTALAEIVETQPVAVLFSIPQSLLSDVRSRLKSGPVAVEALSSEDRRLLGRGRLVLIDNSVDGQTGTVALKASFGNADEDLWPGQLVEARLINGTRHDAIAIPRSAVAPGPQGHFVYVVDADDRIALRPVTLGPTDGGLAIVEFGLAVGERVVLEKQDMLAPGMVVHPMATDSAPAVGGRALPEKPS